jgi:hypothetical protein
METTSRVGCVLAAVVLLSTTLAIACGSFAGTDSSSNAIPDGGSSNDAADASESADGADGAGATMADSGGGPDGASSVDGDADAAADANCRTILTQPFTGILGGGWSVLENGSGLVEVATPPGPISAAMHAQETATTADSAAAYVDTVSITTMPKRFKLTYSAYLSDAWGNAQLNVGCTMTLTDANGKPDVNYMLQRETAGGIAVVVSVGSMSESVALAPAVSAKWYDVQMNLRGIETGMFVGDSTLAAQVNPTAFTASATEPSLGFVPKDVTLRCGITGATSSPDQMVDLWVSNLVLVECD